MDCVFCKTSSVYENLGEFRQTTSIMCSLPKHKFHLNCLLYNSDIEKNADRTEGYNQFEDEDIANAVEKARYRICTFCKKENASIGCKEYGCETRFHLPCALTSKRTFHLHSGAFESFCHEHIPFECIFDGEPITGLVTPVPCCKKVYSHDQCLKKYADEAKSAFKCSLCSNVNEFRTHMQTHLQFDIPDGKPSYNDVEDDVEEDFHCAAVFCKSRSRLGRSLHMEGTAFELILCLYCGSDAIHRICGQGQIGQNDEWTCQSCTTTELIENNGARRTKMSAQRRTFGSSFVIRVPRIPRNNTETQN